MQRLIASRSFPYNHRQMRPGERFSAADKDARFLIAMGRAEPEVQAASLPVQPDMAPPPMSEPPSEEIFTTEAQPKKKRARRGRYERRDERAQE